MTEADLRRPPECDGVTFQTTTDNLREGRHNCRSLSWRSIFIWWTTSRFRATLRAFRLCSAVRPGWYRARINRRRANCRRHIGVESNMVFPLIGYDVVMDAR